jgi:hypothetical protein
LTTSLSLSLSFLCFSFARYVPLIQFGVLSAFVLVLAVFSDLYIGPAVLTWMGLSQQRDMSIQHLIEPELLLESALFHELSMAEIYRVLECSDIKTYPPGTVHLKGFISELDLSEKIENKSGIYTLLKGSSSETSLGNPIQTSTLHLSESSIVLKLNLKKIGHLSPRIFSKICHNLKA